MAITPLPDAPETTDTPQQFNTKAFAWVQSLDTFVTQANAQATEVNNDAELAEDWASKTDGQVAATDYSSKEYAIGTTIRGTVGSSKDWAIYTASTVDGTNYSAKYWADEADTSASEAAASAAAALAAANVTQWSSGATYSAGDNVWSPVDYQTYRNKTGTNTATDPSSDSTNWELVSGNVTLSTEQTLTTKNLKDYSIEGVAIGNTGATRTIDLETGNFFSATLDQACTFTFSNPAASGDFCGFALALTDGSDYAVTWPASVDWVGGNAPTLTASGLDLLVFVTYDGGTTWLGLVSGLDIK